jgi:hypothetical protein
MELTEPVPEGMSTGLLIVIIVIAALAVVGLVVGVCMKMKKSAAAAH